MLTDKQRADCFLAWSIFCFIFYFIVSLGILGTIIYQATKS